MYEDHPDYANTRRLEEELLAGLRARFRDPGNALLLLAIVAARIIRDQAEDPDLIRMHFIQRMDSFLKPPPAGGHTGSEN